jgi:phosphatidylserine decarboxylase
MARAAEMIGIAPEGAPMTFGLVLLGLFLFFVASQVAGIIVLVIAFAFAMFFRDPERLPEPAADVVLAGADGRVTDVSQCAPPGGDREAVYNRVSVFMSLFDVHVNRAPVGGEVVAVEHTPGEFRAAFDDLASEHNERNLIVFADPAGRRHPMVQVAGYLARRIVSRVGVGDKLTAGQRVGLIMFGSRVDHFLPLDYRVAVGVGQRVRAAVTVIGELSHNET